MNGERNLLLLFYSSSSHSSYYYLRYSKMGQTLSSYLSNHFARSLSIYEGQSLLTGNLMTHDRRQECYSWPEVAQIGAATSSNIGMEVGSGDIDTNVVAVAAAAIYCLFDCGNKS